jgi:hypothetical protein
MVQIQCFGFGSRGRDDGMKRYRKTNTRQQARLGSIERKRDTARQRGNVDRRRGSIREGKGKRRHQLG